jgi:hypothetical protein
MGWRRHVRHRVVVNLKTGSAVSGVLYRADSQLLEIKEPTVHEPGAESASADGSMVIERSNVDYVQIVG